MGIYTYIYICVRRVHVKGHTIYEALQAERRTGS